MADFRKWMLVLAVVALFATGIASAQSGTSPLSCTAVGATPPTIRSEGLTELTGDIVITCTGGAQLAPGAQIPYANITVFYNAAVTSRLLGTASVTSASEALLLVDDPGLTNAVGSLSYGNTLPQTVCGYPLQGAGPNGCVEYVGNVGTVSPINYTQLQGGSNWLVPVPTSASTLTPGANVFQGVVSGFSVTFYGVPVLPPVTSGASRSFRITNVRVNANALIGGGSIPNNVTAAIAVTGTASLPLSQSSVNVGFVTTSLNASLLKPLSTSAISTSAITLNQCQSYGSATTPVALETLRFAEAFPSAFKVRGTQSQTIPGFNYFTESGLTVAGITGSSSATGTTYYAGYADWGTRLKAVFTNIPSGVSLFVSTTNLNASDSAVASLNAASSYAALITGETSPDSGPTPSLSTSNLPLITQTGTSSSIGFAPVTNVGGTGQAVWEIVNSLPNTPENLDFEVFMTVTSNTATGIPPAPSTMTVNLSYAPIPTQGAFTLATGQAANATLGIPRFADTSKTANALIFQICQTALLYPYVIDVAGFDTGLSIANTSADPFLSGTAALTTTQAGSCQIWWYGTGAPTVNPGYLGNAGYQTTIPTSTQLIAAGTIQGWSASVSAPGFYGYVIAVCNFQYAHGFAFVSDLGSRQLAMGYLANVMNASGGLLQNRGPLAEGLAQ